ncbi:alpha/beta fold hydrolase [Nonomuraea soli]|uniref:Pimeloyl-ACP methyl ester carboxylesterase n=1 Tax=Nonomuraea soli TaxID=1032476 RepID=A0A7W0CF83_9ACTN|nr:alpha/beta hydrolase [Nonomuraea soli]MBA2890091.1 pimeloyl-ACP methyl ester carboxylesterase [Nonomuraea soli]
MSTTTDYLSVPGASLYYEMRGNGPTLLISQSGEGDAARSADLVERLADAYTVITYDRRGLSRSTLDHPGSAATMTEHADDVHRLLAAVTDEPAAMLGCSLGAVIGLHLALRHTGQLSTLIAHEPVAPRLLPVPDRARHEAELAEIQQLYREQGLAPALRAVADVLGIDPANPDAEPGLTPQPMTSRRIANFGFFIENDFTALINDTLPVNDLAHTPTRIVPAAGRTTPRAVFDYRCAQELATLLGAEVAEFPGGHNGNTTHPRAYAAQLHQILQTAKVG